MARTASANPAAEKLFEDGRTALAADHLDEACDMFRRSEELEARVGTLYNLADCEERRGRIATAWEAFVEAKTLADTAHDKRGAKAAQRAEALLPRLPYLTVAVTRIEGLSITRDGVAVPEAAWNHELPIDPKHYRFQASAPNHVSWSAELDVKEGTHQRLEVPELASVPDKPIDKPVDKPIDKPVDEPHLVIKPLPPRPLFAYRIAPGAFVGLTSRGDLEYGGRLVVNAAPLGPGWLRAVPVLRRWTGTFPDDPYRTFHTVAGGATIEYAYPLTHEIFVAGGAGLGIESQHDSYTNHAYFYVPEVRVTPTLRYDRFEVWIAYELGIGSGPSGANETYLSSDRSIGISHRFELGLDVFVW
ncbi:MAG: hypothetical protein QM831_25085 [Kofleriaceae bacterium]